jgi:DNA-binding response OmpR family regulator
MGSQMMTRPYPRHVLVVEDEYFLADDLKRALDREGFTVVGPVGSEAKALDLLENEAVDCAILDIKLHGQMIYPLARTLRSREVPFLFLTGYDSVEPDTGFDDVELLRKPFTTEAVIQGIHRLIDSANGRIA